MQAVRSTTLKCRRAMVAMAAITMLTACAGTDVAGLMTPATTAGPAVPVAPAATVEPAPSPAATTRSRAARADAPAPPAPATPVAPAAEPSAKLTNEEINTECWMRADADRRLRDIDARLAYVNRCAAERAKSR